MTEILTLQTSLYLTEILRIDRDIFWNLIIYFPSISRLNKVTIKIHGRIADLSNKITVWSLQIEGRVFLIWGIDSEYFCALNSNSPSERSWDIIIETIMRIEFDIACLSLDTHISSVSSCKSSIKCI